MITIDKSGAKKQAIRIYNKRNYKRIKWRQCMYLNNIVEQDHRFIKWRIQQGLGFKEFQSAQRTQTGIEIVRMIKKNQLDQSCTSTFKPCCSLTAWSGEKKTILESRSNRCDRTRPHAYINSALNTLKMKPKGKEIWFKLDVLKINVSHRNFPP